MTKPTTEPTAPPPKSMAMAKLIDTINLAAAQILARANGSVTVAPSGDGEGEASATPTTAPAVSLKDQIEAFRAVVAWAETLAKLEPPPPAKPEKKGAKFNGLRDQFDRASPGRGGPRSTGAGGEPDDPAGDAEA